MSLHPHLLATGGGGGVISGLPRRGDVLLMSSGSLLPPKCLPRLLPHSSAGRRGMTKPVDIPGGTQRKAPSLAGVTQCNTYC